MIRRNSALRAYLELSRVSNLPTVWSNVLVGIAIGATAAPLVATSTGETSSSFAWQSAALVAVGISLFYVAGMALNDVLDVEVDRLERPQRPIPSGRVTRRSAVVFTIAMLTLGLLLISTVSLRALAPAAILGLLIILYDFLHRHSVLMVLVMGACRALVYVTAAVAINWPLEIPQAWAFPTILAAYIVGVSLVARGEAPPGNPPGKAPDNPPGNPPSDPPARWNRLRVVLTLLAGISLLDAALLVSLGFFWPAGLAVACFFLTMAGHRHIMGT